MKIGKLPNRTFVNFQHPQIGPVALEADRVLREVSPGRFLVRLKLTQGGRAFEIEVSSSDFVGA